MNNACNTINQYELNVMGSRLKIRNTNSLQIFMNKTSVLQTKPK